MGSNALARYLRSAFWGFDLPDACRRRGTDSQAKKLPKYPSSKGSRRKNTGRGKSSYIMGHLRNEAEYGVIIRSANGDCTRAEAEPVL